MITAQDSKIRLIFKEIYNMKVDKFYRKRPIFAKIRIWNFNTKK